MSTIDVKCLVCPVCGGTISSIVYTSIFSAGMTRWSNGTVHSSHGLQDTFRYMGCPHCKHASQKNGWKIETETERVAHNKEQQTQSNNEPLHKIFTILILLDTVLADSAERMYVLGELFKETSYEWRTDPQSPHHEKSKRYMDEYIDLLSKEPHTPENVIWRAEVLRENGKYKDSLALISTLPKDSLTDEQKRFVKRLVHFAEQKKPEPFRVITREEEEHERNEELLRQIEEARDPAIRFAEAIDSVLRMFSIKIDKIGISTRLSDDAPCVYIYMSSDHDVEVWRRVSKQIQAVFTGSEFRVGGENNLVLQVTVSDRFKTRESRWDM